MNLANITGLRRFKRRTKTFYDTHYADCDGCIDENDVFIDEDRLKLVLGLARFQPRRDTISARHTFIGPTVHSEIVTKSCEIIYVSVRSIFADNRAFFEQCIDALADIDRRVVISLGNRFEHADFTDVPANTRATSVGSSVTAV